MSEVVMRCPVCEENAFTLGEKIFDDRYGEPNCYRLARCMYCSHLATAPRLSEADLPALYGTYYPRKNINPDAVVQEAAKVKRVFSGVIRWWNGIDNQGHYGVRAGETMLDVGCGSGVSLIEAKALGANVFGIEADPNVKDIATALDLTIHFGSLLDQPFPEQKFDLIVLNQVIEHLPEPDEALKRLRERLTPNGRIVLVFPNTASIWRRISGNRWINWHIPYHLHHFDLKGFERMVRHCRLEICRSRTITPNVWTLMQLRACCYQANLGQPSPIWAVPDRSAVASPNNQKLNLVRLLLRGVVMNLLAIINRIVDVLGLGDSLMVELRRNQK